MLTLKMSINNNIKSLPMKKFCILLCFVFLITSLGMAKPISKEVTESKTKIAKQNITLIQLLNKKNAQRPTLKSTVAKSKKLEKITFADGGYKEFIYNEQGLTVDFKSYKPDEATGTVILSEHNTIGYDGHGNKALQIFNTRMEGELTTTEKDEFEYDSQNRETLHINYEYSYSYGILIKYSKTVTSYQANGIKTEDHQWDEEAQTWNLEGKSEIELKNGYIVKGTYYSKNEETGVVAKTMIMEATYNDKNQLTQMLTKGVDEETGLIVDFMKTVNSFDSNGNEVLSVDSMYDSESGTWMEWSKTKSIFNASNVLTSDEYYMLNWMSFQLTISEKHEYSYTNGKLTQELVWEDEDMDGEISQSYKYEFAYDNSINIDDVALPDSWIEHNDFSDIWGEFQFSFGALSNVKWYQWDYDTEALKKYRDATYHYSSSGSGVAVNTLGVSCIKVGPNPFSESISVTLPESAPATVSVYNIAGLKVFSTQIKGYTAISTSPWEKGIYTIYFSAESGKIETFKLLKK
jgi:hypothetical protein